MQVANQREAERAALGRAERQYLEEIAQGQKAQAEVLGQDRVAMLQALDKVLTSLEREPSLVAMIGKFVPNTVVNGSGLEGAAAILGNAIGAEDAALTLSLCDAHQGRPQTALAHRIARLEFLHHCAGRLFISGISNMAWWKLGSNFWPTASIG